MTPADPSSAVVFIARTCRSDRPVVFEVIRSCVLDVRCERFLGDRDLDGAHVVDQSHLLFFWVDRGENEILTEKIGSELHHGGRDRLVAGNDRRGISRGRHGVVELWAIDRDVRRRPGSSPNFGLTKEEVTAGAAGRIVE